MENEQSLISEESIEIPANDSVEVSFEDLGLDEYTLKAVEKKGFVTPSPIQVLAIPRLLNGDTNLIARARTGTGKTAAFGLPIIQSIRTKGDNVQALILEPTRELAMQTCAELQSFTEKNGPRTCVLYGGASYSNQIRELKSGAEIVVGTPGRIKDHIERKTLNLSKIKYFILDEGDEMLDMGFIDDIEDIFKQANPNSRILLFSATMPEPILKIAGKFMGEYETIEEEGVIDEPLLIDQKYWVVRESDKIEALVRLIDMTPDFYGLVFTQTKMDADNVCRQLDLRGYESAALHGDIMQNQREKVLERFRSKKTRILVATDVAARGIDISCLSHVVNYSLPFDAATYVHRIGRTGRAGKTGIAVTFVRPEERRKLGFMISQVKKSSKGEITEAAIPSIPDVLKIKQENVFLDLQNKLFPVKENREILPGNDDLDDETIKIEQEAVPTTEESAISENETVETPVEEAAAPKLFKAPESFKNLAHTLCENQNPEDVLASVLTIIYGDKISSKHYGNINAQRSFSTNSDQLRIYVQIGKKDGYRAKDIADYFSNMLHIPGRMVDQIDMAQQFTLLNLPIEAAKKAIEMSQNDNQLPHMHLDSKNDEKQGRRRSPRGSRGGDRGGRGGRDRDNRDNKDGLNLHREGRDFSDRRGSRSRSSDRGFDRSSDNFREGRSKGSRPNYHTQSERNGSASLYKRPRAKKAETF